MTQQDVMKMKLGTQVKCRKTGAIYRVIRYMHSPQGTMVLAQLGKETPREFQADQVDVP